MSDSKRIEEFYRKEKDFLYIDLTGLDSYDELNKISKEIKSIIDKYPPGSLYIIINLEKIKYDSESIKMLSDFIKSNKGYVKYAVIIGIDGPKKFMINHMISINERKKLFFSFSKEKAMDLLLDKE